MKDKKNYKIYESIAKLVDNLEDKTREKKSGNRDIKKTGETNIDYDNKLENNNRSNSKSSYFFIKRNKERNIVGNNPKPLENKVSNIDNSKGEHMLKYKLRIKNTQEKPKIKSEDKKDNKKIILKNQINKDDNQIKQEEIKKVDNNQKKVEIKETKHIFKKKTVKKEKKDYIKKEKDNIILSKKKKNTPSINFLSKNIKGKKNDDLDIKYEKLDDIFEFVFTDEEINDLKLSYLNKLGFSDPALYKELDFYPMVDNFAYVLIIEETQTLDRLYISMEFQLNSKEIEFHDFVKETLSGLNLDTTEYENTGREKFLMNEVNQIIKDYDLNIEMKSLSKIKYYLKKDLVGLGILDPIMKDPNIEDISCDGSETPVFLYHRIHGSLRTNIVFEDEDVLYGFVVKLAQRCGKHISIASPMLDATMPDGSRIQMTLSTEVTTKGSTFTIRKFKEDPFSPSDLIEFNTLSSEMVAYMWLAVENGVNALISGGTASGKTSTLNALALFVPRTSKIVTIEETREINLPHPNWIPGVARVGFGEVVGDKVAGEIDMYDLMKAALRQRPEYILVGEIRGREAYVLFQAMATGHTTYSTVHADSAKSLIHRLEGKPIEIPRIMLQALDIICIQSISRVEEKRARRCKQIIEIIDIDPVTKEILTNEVFRWDPISDKFIYSGKSYVLEKIRTNKGLKKDEMINELHRRTRILDWMRKKNIRGFKDVASMIAKYFENPEDVLSKVEEEL